MADYGVELYGDAIMASPAFAEEKPEAVRAFLRAYVKALKDAVRDPAHAVEVLLRHDERLEKDIELERLRMAIRDNIVTPAVKANGFGGIDPRALCRGDRSDRARPILQGEGQGRRGFRSVVLAAGGGAQDRRRRLAVNLRQRLRR